MRSKEIFISKALMLPTGRADQPFPAQTMILVLGEVFFKFRTPLEYSTTAFVNMEFQILCLRHLQKEIVILSCG
jgi:hypothetical protein